MDGWGAWKLHKAVKIHFNLMDYDIVESKGKIKNSSLEIFLKQNNRKVFEYIANQFDRPYELMEYFISCIIYTPDDTVNDRSISFDLYQKYKLHKESLTKFILDDIDKLDVPNCFESDNSIPTALKGVVCGEILPQTLAALDDKFNFLLPWIDNKLYFGFERYPVKIYKLKRFLKYNKERVSNTLEEKLSYASI